LNALKAQADGLTAAATALQAQVDALQVQVNNLPAGPAGPQGPPGNDGGPGPAGPAGPAVASAVVDAVNTLNPDDPATVATSFDGTNAHFTYGIPRGHDGAPGAPGEVSNADLAAAIAGTSSNTNAVATLGLVASDPATQSEVQAIADKVDEFLTAARR
ncbi:MAG: hypothetical protein HY301_13395, partial [Verrucomicrobia bacterium]|nr:hypothetical protein [Verrucomicrobiota bacterium]